MLYLTNKFVGLCSLFSRSSHLSIQYNYFAVPDADDAVSFRSLLIICSR